MNYSSKITSSIAFSHIGESQQEETTTQMPLLAKNFIKEDPYELDLEISSFRNGIHVPQTPPPSQNTCASVCPCVTLDDESRQVH